jgi:ubiquinone/menaquinone biosynthesis C-methylase UbiE
VTLPRAVNAPELIDEEAHDPRELAQSLGHVAAVNRWLGGTRALLQHVRPFMVPGRVTRILDVGTGSGDLPHSLAQWARVHERAVQIVATDVHPQMVAIARATCANDPEITIEKADARALDFPDSSFDVATLSLTLHHFDDAEQIQILRELARVTRSAVIVNELHRTRLNYAGARLLALTVWRGNRLTRHDGPLSVLRAFTRSELLELCAAAGMNGRIYTRFFQRMILVATPSAKAAAAKTELK